MAGRYKPQIVCVERKGGNARMNILLFGTGEYYERYKKWFYQENVLALLDNSSAKQGTHIDGILVLSPEEGVRLAYDIVVILSFYVKEMKKQLLACGVAETCIYHFYDLNALFTKKAFARKEAAHPIQYYGNPQKILCAPPLEDRKKVVLISHDLTLGGPAIALFHAAQILKKNGYDVVVASMIDGPLKDIILENKIPVIVDVSLQVKTMAEVSWVQNFQIVLCNTNAFCVFLSDRDTSIPVIWWLHDSAFFYDGINKNLLCKISRKNLAAVSAGPVPEKAIQNLVPDFPAGRLIYGVADHGACGAMRRKTDRVVFVTIGYAEPRKGQNILVEAVQRIRPEIRKKAVFYLIGQNTSLFAQELKKRISCLPEIEMFSEVGREEINDILKNADVMVCPSREDPMPTVAAEAMMHSVPCIVSDATGTAECITDGINGYIFKSGDIQNLSDRLACCIGQKENLKRTGQKARKLYEKYFSMEVFEKELLRLLTAVGQLYQG